MGRKRGKHYINGEEFRKDIIESLNNLDEEGNPRLTKGAIDKIQLLINRLLNHRYSDPMDRDDAKSFAWMDILKYWTNYNPDKASTPFSYYTSMILIASTKFLKKMHGDRKKLNTIRINFSEDNEIFSI